MALFSAVFSIYAQLASGLHDGFLASRRIQRFAAPGDPGAGDAKVVVAGPEHGAGRDAAPTQSLLQNMLGACLEVPESRAGEVSMWECGDTKPKQQWAYDEHTGQIRGAHGSCLHALERNTTGGQVRMQECDATSSHQQWALNRSTGQIRNREGICLDGTNAGDVRMRQCDASSLLTKEWSLLDPETMIADVGEGEAEQWPGEAGGDHYVVPKFSWFRFTPTGLRGDDDPPLVQLAEIVFAGPDGADLQTCGAGVYAFQLGGRTPIGEGPSRAIDCRADTKWLDLAAQALVVRFPEAVTATAFTFVTANDSVKRDPVQWELEGASDGMNWVLLHSTEGVPARIAMERGVRNNWFLMHPHGPPTSSTTTTPATTTTTSGAATTTTTSGAATTTTTSGAATTTTSSGAATTTTSSSADPHASTTTTTATASASYAALTESSATTPTTTSQASSNTVVFSYTTTTPASSAWPPTDPASARPADSNTHVFKYFRFTVEATRDWPEKADMVHVSEIHLRGDDGYDIPWGSLQARLQHQGRECQNYGPSLGLHRSADDCAIRSRIYRDCGYISFAPLDPALECRCCSSPTPAGPSSRSLYEVWYTAPNEPRQVVATNPSGDNPVDEKGESLEGALKALDGDVGTKWLDLSAEPMIMEFNSPVAVNAFTFSTGNDFPGRDPVQWTFEGSDDAETWFLLHRTEGAGAEDVTFVRQMKAEWYTFAYAARMMPCCSAYHVFRFLPMRTRSPVADCYQIAEFKLMGGDYETPYAGANFLASGTGKGSVAVTASNPNGDNPDEERPEKLLDDSSGSKFLDFNIEPVVFTFARAVRVLAFSFVTANDFPERDPVQWLVQGSHDGVEWADLHSTGGVDADVPAARETETPVYQFRMPPAAPAGHKLAAHPERS